MAKKSGLKKAKKVAAKKRVVKTQKKKAKGHSRKPTKIKAKKAKVSEFHSRTRQSGHAKVGTEIPSVGEDELEPTPNAESDGHESDNAYVPVSDEEYVDAENDHPENIDEDDEGYF